MTLLILDAEVVARQFRAAARRHEGVAREVFLSLARMAEDYIKEQRDQETAAD